jgi:hypothetical protein
LASGIILFFFYLSIAIPALRGQAIFNQTTTISLTPSLPSGQPVGTPITWTATASPTQSLLYQFSAAGSNGQFLILRDVWDSPAFTWTPLIEGTYQIRVVTAPLTGGAQITTTVSYTITSRVTGTHAVVSTTAHPLVALYSAPVCNTGDIFVEFSLVGSSTWQETNAIACNGTTSENFYVGGMLPSTTYNLRHVLLQGSTYTPSASTEFTTGPLPSDQQFPTYTLIDPATSQSSVAEQVVLHSVLDPDEELQSIPVATDLFGRIIWYYNAARAVPSVSLFYVTRPIANGTFLMLTECCNNAEYIVSIIDLAGNTVRQTQMSWINAQLNAMGKESVIDFDHEAIYFSNGQILLLGMTQNTANPPVLGDMIIALNSQLQVTWAWDAFDYLSTSRLPPLRETCYDNYGTACPASNPDAIDWLHGNSLAYSPTDHNLIFSMRDQDWVIKINYQDGTGPGNIIWTLGLGGNFSIQGGTQTWPWFSHQHDVEWVASEQIALFDNGNTRCAVLPAPCYSRGQVYTLNETSLVATQVLSEGLGVFSNGYGTAELLSNGDYDFAAGWAEPALNSFDFEITPTGSTVYNLESSDKEYRIIRMKSLYLQ